MYVYGCLSEEEVEYNRSNQLVYRVGKEEIGKRIVGSISNIVWEEFCVDCLQKTICTTRVGDGDISRAVRNIERKTDGRVLSNFYEYHNTDVGPVHLLLYKIDTSELARKT